MTSYTNVFGGTVVSPTDVSYNSITLASNTSLQWPIEGTTGSNVVADIMDITATTSGLSLVMPDARVVSEGVTIRFNNVGSNTFSVTTNDGNVIVAPNAGEVWEIYLRDNATLGGNWGFGLFGGTGSTANAGSLAGPGLSAIGAQLGQTIPAVPFSSNYTASYNNLAQALIWTGGTGTLNLPIPGTVGANYFIHVKNAGSGTLTVSPNAGTIDTASSITLNINDSCIILTDGSNYFTIGRGQSVSSSFTYLAIDVSGSGDYVLAAAQQGKSVYRCTGTLSGNRNLVVPTTLAQYIVDNSTSGAFTFTVKTASGTGVVVTSGQRTIVYCDGTNVLLADTGSGGGLSNPVLVSQGGTGATTVASARANLGSTSTGDALFTSSSAASARTTLGSGVVGDVLFTSGTATVVWGQIGAARTISTSGYLTGGGDLSANRSLALGSMNNTGRLLGSGTGAATITDITLGAGLVMSGTTLATSGVGTITAVNAGTGMSGGGTSGSVTLNVNIPVTAWAYVASAGTLTAGSGFASVSRTATGRYTLTLSSAAASTNYAILATSTVSIVASVDTSVTKTTTVFGIDLRANGASDINADFYVLVIGA